MRTIVWTYLLLYFVNYVDIHLGIFTLTIRDSILCLIPFIGLKSILTDPPFRKRILPIILLFSSVMLISVIYIMLNFSFPFITILKRTIVQYFKHLLIIFEVYIGFRLFHFLTPKEFISLQLKIALVLILLGLYQVFADTVGLPYWGINTFRDEAVDKTVAGMRPNSLLGEPKAFAAYLTLTILLIQQTYRFQIRSKLFCISLLCFAVFLWYLTQSGNGALAAIVIIVVSTFLSGVNPYMKAFLGLSLSVGSFYFWQNAEQLLVRPSHKLLITAMKHGTFAQLTLLLDDLVRLPLMAFAKYELFVWTGFGLGLLTFYATEFLYLAQWKTGGWIDSNISIISNISNYGILFLLFLFYYMTTRFVAARNRLSLSPSVQATTVYLYYSFVVGLLVSGRHTALIFLAVGYMMSTTLPLEEQIPNEEDRQPESTFS